MIRLFVYKKLRFDNCFTVPSESDSAKGGTGTTTFARTLAFPLQLVGTIVSIL